MNIAIFASGSGTNCENLIKHFADSESVNCALVVSNKAEPSFWIGPNGSVCLRLLPLRLICIIQM